MMRCAILILFLTVLPAFAQACPAPPVGTANDTVLQMKPQGGTAGLGPSSAITTIGEGTVVYDDANNQIVMCDGTNWIPFVSAPPSCTGANFLQWDGSSWARGGLSTIALNDLSDVVIATPDDGVPLIYDDSTGNWVNKTCDDSPNTLFPDLVNQTLSTLVSSSIRLMEGITCGTIPVSISGQGVPEYRICADSGCSSVTTNWTTATNNISAGDYIQVRLTTAGFSDTTYTAAVTMGSVADNWDVTTEGPKTVFLSSTSHDGDMGGLAGADSICQGLADAAGLGGTYKAWLSDHVTDVASRFYQSTQQYRLIDGTKVADNWADLTDGTLDNPIDLIEINTRPSTNLSRVWASTQTNGTRYTPFHDFCDNTWISNSSSFDGDFGLHDRVNSSWTRSNNTSCNNQYRLYCFEQ